ncbi:unnamed protein product, partial [marine sediment metagenome]
DVDTNAPDAALRIRHGRSMARLARVVVPGLPHHVTQRGVGLTTGRPAGSDEFVRGLEKRLGRSLAAVVAQGEPVVEMTRSAVTSIPMR